MKFVLQDRYILFDFQYELYHQKEYYDWLNRCRPKEEQTEFIICTESELNKVLPDADLKEWCPVGSVEYCVNWYKNVWGKTPLPKNVPDELFKMCNRKIINMETSDEVGKIIPSEDGNRFNDKYISFPTMSTNKIFRKDTKTIKSDWNGIIDKDDDMRFNDSDHHYHNHFQISEVMNDINSEWRCFIYRNQLIDMKCYSGDFFDVPSEEYITKCINTYSDVAPVAYTLDICTRDKHPNEVIEVHDFFSCGLYGFSDSKLPLMLWRWFKEFTKE